MAAHGANQRAAADPTQQREFGATQEAGEGQELTEVSRGRVRIHLHAVPAIPAEGQVAGEENSERREDPTARRRADGDPATIFPGTYAKLHDPVGALHVNADAAREGHFGVPSTAGACAVQGGHVSGHAGAVGAALDVAGERRLRRVVQALLPIDELLRMVSVEADGAAGEAGSVAPGSARRRESQEVDCGQAGSGDCRHDSRHQAEASTSGDVQLHPHPARTSHSRDYQKGDERQTDAAARRVDGLLTRRPEADTQLIVLSSDCSGHSGVW